MNDQLWSGLRDFTASMLQQLDRRERFIIRSRYALGSHRRVRSFQDLANKLGVSKERVRQLEARAVGKLKAMAKDFRIDEFRLSTNA
jgi:RNA polymerase primary sigma factor